MPPLLTIYVPTYNRAHLLVSLLRELAIQVRQIQDPVEIIVSDNCSTDETRECVRRLQELWPIRYSCNPTNLGAMQNILQCGQLVGGEFTWIIGDDDLVRPGAVARVVSVIKEYPKVDYIFVNFSMVTKDTRDLRGRDVASSDFPQLEPTGGCSLVDRHLNEWEEMIDPALDRSFMGAIQSSVFRTSRWREHALNIDRSCEYVLLESTYPQLMIFAHTLRGREAFYIGHPYVIAFSGYQAYNPRLPYIYTVIIPAIFDMYEALGLDPDRINRYRQFVLRDIARLGIQRMVLCPWTPGRSEFRLLSFFWRHRRFPGELAQCLQAIFSPRPVIRRLRKVADACKGSLAVCIGSRS